MTTSFQYYLPTQIHVENGLFRKVASSIPGSRVLIVCGGGELCKLGILTMLKHTLEEQRINSIVYDKAEGFPSDISIASATNLGRAEGCTCVLALGGGAAINTAKAVAALCSNPGRISDYACNGKRRLQARPLPLVCVPTTAESTCLQDYLFVRSENGLCLMRHSWLHPALCLIDPRLNLTVPPRATAFHGYAALLMATGALLAPSPDPISVSLALTAWRQLSDIIPACIANGQDATARSAAAEATLLAAIAGAASPCPAEAALSIAMSAAVETLPVGLSLAMLAPEWHKAAAEHHPARYEKVEIALGLHQTLPECLREFRHICDLDDTAPQDYNIDPLLVSEVVESAINSLRPLSPLHGCPLPQQEIVALAQKVYTD